MKTAVLEGRCDLRDLAACAYFMIEKGATPHTKSELFYLCVETLANACVKSGGKRFDTNEEAHAYFLSIGLGPIVRNKGDRRMGLIDLSKAIEHERKEGKEPDLEGKDEYDEELIRREKLLEILRGLK